MSYRLSKRKFSTSYNQADKQWSARGIYDEEVVENSIESIRRAFDNGLKGVEVDVYFDVTLGDFIVSHDRPYQLVNGSLLTLGELFNAVGDSQYFWLDFKKLRSLTHAQALQAVQRLKSISSRQDLARRIYVEGETPINLALFRDAGFHTIFDTHPTHDSFFLTPMVIAVYKIVFYFGRHSVMGMEYGTMSQPVYGERTRKRLGNIPVFLYHVPDNQELVAKLGAMQAVRVMVLACPRIGK